MPDKNMRAANVIVNSLMGLVEHCSWGVTSPAHPACPAWQVARECSQVERPLWSIQLFESSHILKSKRK